MRKDPALVVGGLLFALVALAHLLRLIFETPIMIGQTAIPMSLSVIGLIVAAFMSLWMFLAVQSKK